jgi:uncharacterized membrane protein YgdD (TMEM256/DUF423 family)
MTTQQAGGTAALAGAIAVALGAFAAHGLKAIWPAELLATFETGVKYQFYHALALLLIALLLGQKKLPAWQWAGRLFTAGIFIFCGSLYLLCIAKHVQWPLLWLGAITPLGGLCFIGGWLMLGVGFFKT